MRTVAGRSREVKKGLNRGQALIREQNKRAQDRLDAMRDKRRTAESIMHANAVITGLLPRVQAAVDAWCGKRVPLRLNLRASSFMAATDFTSIWINVPEAEVSADYAGDFRGLAYHEAGHIVRTVPLTDLLASVSGENDLDHQETWLSQHHGLTLDEFRMAWNAVEDQRMETGMVAESQNLAAYYNVIVLTHLFDQGMTPDRHLLTYGRHHVDADVRAVARQAMIDCFGPDVVEEAEQTIRGYMAATDLSGLFQHALAFAKLAERLGASMPQMDNHLNPDDAMSAGEASKRAQEGAAPRPTDDVVPVPSDDPKDVLGKALQDARAQRNADGNLTGDQRSFNDAMRAGEGATPLERMQPVPNLDPQANVTADNINRNLRTILEQARAETAPSWQEGQTNGVLNVIRYKTRQPGDREFFRGFAPGGDLMYPNLAVSLVLDGSGSMRNHDEALGIAAYAVKSACMMANVPCTVTVYDTNAYVLYEHDDRPDEVSKDFIPNGNTDPLDALEMLDGQMQDKANHLVIIMTDGQWSQRWHHGDCSLADYALPKRDIVTFFYQTAVKSINGGEVSDNIRIDDLNEIPRFLSRYILRAL